MDEFQSHSVGDIEFPALTEPLLPRAQSAKPRALGLGNKTNSRQTSLREGYASSAPGRAPLSPFERIKLHTNRNAAHGHPLILPSSYGDFGPVFDVIALFQNAVKREVLLAYDMLETMARNKYEVSHVELNMFLDWFDTFEEVLLVIFDVEEHEVYPYLLEVGVVIPDKLCAEKRKKMTDGIRHSIEQITEKRELFQYLPAGESVPRFSQLLNNFLKLTVEYYDVQSETLPRLIFEANIDGDLELVLRQRFMSALKSRSQFTTTIPFMTHWLTDKQLRVWKTNYLTGRDIFRFEQWARKFESQHQSIPSRIQKKIAKAKEVKSPSSVASPSSVPGTPRFPRRNKAPQDGPLSFGAGQRNRLSHDDPSSNGPSSIPITPRFGRKVRDLLKN